MRAASREFSLPLTLKRADPAAAGTFRGLAATFERDRAGDVIERGAFAETLRGLADRGARLPLLWLHDMATPVGAITSAAESELGLEVFGALALGTEAADRAYALMKTGGLSLSIGFVIPEGAARAENGTRHITALDLHEVSLVPVPANTGAVIEDMKAAVYGSPASFARTLRDALGLTRREAEVIAKSAWPSLPHASGATAEDGADLIADAAELAGALASLKRDLKE